MRAGDRACPGRGSVLVHSHHGAFIETLSISHSDDGMEEEAVIYPDYEDELEELVEDELLDALLKELELLELIDD